MLPGWVIWVMQDLGGEVGCPSTLDGGRWLHRTVDMRESPWGGGTAPGDKPCL